MFKQTTVYTPILDQRSDYFFCLEVVSKKLKSQGGGCVQIGIIPDLLKDHPMQRSDDVDYVRNKKLTWLCLCCSKRVGSHFQLQQHRNFSKYFSDGFILSVSLVFSKKQIFLYNLENMILAKAALKQGAGNPMAGLRFFIHNKSSPNFQFRVLKFLK